MRLLILSDIHGHIPHLPLLVQAAAGVDALVVAGDITHFGGVAEAAQVLDALADLGDIPLLAVSGNCDRPEVRSVLEQRNCCLEQRMVALNGVHFLGLGGGLRMTGMTPSEYPEEHFQQCLGAFTASETQPPLVLVSHQPPLNTAADQVKHGAHVGSVSVRNFILETQPILAVTGHIHESRCVDKLGAATLLNPGAWKEGYYAVVDVDLPSGRCECRLCSV